MQILKYILFAILLLFGLFLLLGLIKSSVSYGHEITVNKPIKEAWAVHQDPSKLGSWLKGFKSIELLSGTEGAVGSTYKVVVNPGEGQEDFVMTETLVSKKAHDHITLHFDSDMMLFDQTTKFTDNNGKTTIKTYSQVSGKGIMMRSMFAVMEMFGGAFQKQEVENIENLKKLIEANTMNYYSTRVTNSGAVTIPEN